jgi:lysophospholipase L1-like esterase
MRITRREFLAAVPAAGALRAAERPFYLRDGERVVFLGDSITQAGAYVEYIEAALLARLPERRFDIIKLGLSSETASGLSEPDHPFPRPNVHNRLDRALTLTKPQVVCACYGMNDGIYYPLGEERFAAFRAGVRKLLEKVRAAGARAVLLTPPPFDALAKKDVVLGPGAAKYSYKTPYRAYDEVLARYGKWVMSLGAADVTVVDVHGPMARYAAERRRSEPGFTLARDGIHPASDGHWLMARAVLAAWGLPAGARETTFRYEAGPFEWECPVPVPPDPYRLKVSGAPRRVRIFEGGRMVGEADTPRGIELLRLAELSANRRAAEVLALVAKRWAGLGPAWLSAVGHSRAKPAMPLAEAQRQAGALLEEARAAARPIRLRLRMEAM